MDDPQISTKKVPKEGQNRQAAQTSSGQGVNANEVDDAFSTEKSKPRIAAGDQDHASRREVADQSGRSRSVDESKAGAQGEHRETARWIDATEQVQELKSPKQLPSSSFSSREPSVATSPTSLPSMSFDSPTYQVETPKSPNTDDVLPANSGYAHTTKREGIVSKELDQANSAERKRQSHPSGQRRRVREPRLDHNIPNKISQNDFGKFLYSGVLVPT